MSTSTLSPASGGAAGSSPSASADAGTLSAEEIIRAFWFAQARISNPGIRFRWDPALVARLAKVHESDPVPWKSEPQWLRIMPQLTAWHVIDD